MNIDAEPLSSQKAQDSIQPMRVLEFVAIALFALALGITTIRAIMHADSQYVGLGASVSADVATTARTFATEGIWKLRGVPVNNNPPIGPDDQYRELLVIHAEEQGERRGPDVRAFVARYRNQYN